MNESKEDVSIPDVVAKLNAILDTELSGQDNPTLFAKVVAQLMLSRKKYDQHTTRSNDFEWLTDAYVAGVVGPLGPQLLKLHQFLVNQGATPDNPYDFEHCDRYGAVFSNNTWKSMAFQTQSTTYMVVLQPAKVFIADAQGNYEARDDWAIHIRACTHDESTWDLARPEFKKLGFLAQHARVYPEIGYGPQAHEYFRYKDGRDRGYLCSVTPSFDGQGYQSENTLWGPAFTHLGYVLQDLAFHYQGLPEVA